MYGLELHEGLRGVEVVSVGPRCVHVLGFTLDAIALRQILTGPGEDTLTREGLIAALRGAV